jgi:hypothetical protein
MAWVGELVYAFLRAVLPWLFSGETTTVIKEASGLKDMDDIHGGNLNLPT